MPYPQHAITQHEGGRQNIDHLARGLDGGGSVGDSDRGLEVFEGSGYIQGRGGGNDSSIGCG